MTPDNAVLVGATRITLEFWTVAPYSQKEKDVLLNDFAELVTEFDPDVVENSVEMKFEAQSEIVAAVKSPVTRDQLIEAMLDAEILTTTIRFGEAYDDLVVAIPAEVSGE